jgi:hypothetical protein
MKWLIAFLVAVAVTALVANDTFAQQCGGQQVAQQCGSSSTIQSAPQMRSPNFNMQGPAPEFAAMRSTWANGSTMQSVVDTRRLPSAPTMATFQYRKHVLPVASPRREMLPAERLSVRAPTKMKITFKLTNEKATTTKGQFAAAPIPVAKEPLHGS